MQTSFYSILSEILKENHCKIFRRMATKKHENPYDNTLLKNAIRATTLLINIGTKIIQDLLDKCVRNEQELFQNCLNENKSYQGLAEFLQQNRERINNLKLFEEQRTRLYPSPTTTATSVNKFDMTLCFLLLRHILKKPIKGWHKDPADDDVSLQASIIRMTFLRNMNYGHVSEMRLEDDQLERLKTMLAKNVNTKEYSFVAKFELSLRNILVHISGDDKEKNKRLEQFERSLVEHLEAELGTSDIDKYKDKITLIFASDFEAVESVRKFIEKSYSNHEKVSEMLENIKNIESETSRTVNLVIKNQKMLNTGIRDLLTHVQFSNLSLAKIYAQNESVIIEIQKSTHQIIEKIQNIAEESERQKTEICSQVVNQIDQAYSTLLTQNEENIDKLIESISKSVKIEFKFCKEISLEELKEYFQSNQYTDIYLRVLIIDIQAFHLAVQKDSEVVLRSIAETEWNVIIHICSPCEENTHLSNDICRRFRKNYYREDSHSLQKISDLSLVFKNEKMLYVNVSPEEESEQSYTESLRQYFIEKFPKDLLKEATVVCVNYLPNGFFVEEHLDAVDDLNKAFRDGLLRVTSHEKIELSLEWTFLVSKDLSPTLQAMLNKKPPTKVEKYFLPSTTAQISNSLLQLLPSEEREDLEVPGKDGDILWTKENQKRYEAYFEVYHKNVGAISEENSTESYLENKKKNFILGDEIDPETIFINDHLNFTTYVNCSLIDDYKNKIVLKAKKKEFFKNNQLIYPIQHEPSCGGTTIGRVLLFRLSKTLPCVRLKYLDKDDVIVEGLNKLGLDSDLPIVILIDTEAVFYGESFDLSKVEEFSKRLRRIEYRPHFIILVYRSFSGTNLPKLTDKDIQKYQQLYEPYITQTNLDFKQSEYRLNLLNIRLILLRISSEKFSETQKHEQKQKLSNMCKSYLENFNEYDRELIIFMHFWAKFSSNGYMNSTIVSLLLGEIDQNDLVYQFRQFVEDANQKPLFDVFNMLLYQARKGFKLIDSRMSNFFIELIVDDKNPMEEFYRIIAKILRNSGERAKKDELDEVIKLTSTFFIPKLSLRNPSSKNKLNLKENQRNSNSEEEEEREIAKPFPIKSKFEFYSPLVEESIATLGVEATSNNLVELAEIYQEIRKNLDNNKLPFLISVTARFEFHVNRCQINGIKIMKKALGVRKSICSEYLRLEENVKNTDLLTIYGDLHRHFMNHLIFNTTTSLSEIEEVAFESLFSYEKAHDLDRNNPFALIGECKLRKSIIRNIYFGMKCENKHGTFKSKINDKDFELAKDSLVAINKKFDILINLREQINDFDGIFQECVINTVELFNDSRPIESIFKESPVSFVRFNAFEVMKLHLQKKSERKMDWKDLQPNHLEMIIDRTKLQLNESREKASNDFRNLILAYINAAMKKMSHKDIGSMSAALTRALQWKIKYPNEPDSYYYFGVLKLIEYIDTGNIRFLKEVNSNLEQCKKIYQEMKNPCAPRGFNKMEFLIGKQMGLQRLIQHDDKANIEKLQEFEEELESYHHTPVFRLKKIVELKCLSNRAFHDDDVPKKADAGQHPRYKFFISIRRSGLCMFKYRCCNDS